ncbi:MAG: TlpA disulfide reductase family protein [Bacteroidales bacterium]|nr:TlpA disulfide reductase family protein [Bacteroidales bacterium]
MRQLLFFSGLLLASLAPLQAQPWLIQGTIENCEAGKVELASFYGDCFRVLDSVDTRMGSFHFLLSEEAPAGIYRIIYTERAGEVRSQNRFVEFIFNRENVEILAASTELGPVPDFDASLENQVYAGFLDFELAYEAQLMDVYGDLYPFGTGQEEDEKAAVRAYDSLQIDRNRYMDSITELYPDLYAVRIMNAFRAPVIPGEMSHIQRIDTLKQCFFDQAAIDDPQLLTAPVYPFKLIDYLSLYKDLRLEKEEQEEQFIKAVDQIMLHVPEQEELRSFVVDFLLEGFEMLDMDVVQAYLLDHYLDEACETDLVELIQARMEADKQMAAGTSAPDFEIRDIEGQSQDLSDLSASYVLVLFWASSCQHCREMLPELHHWYLTENSLRLEVVAISLDSSAADFRRFVDELDPQWITVHEPRGWNGEVPSAYHIYATPGLFLLDSEQTILARPRTFRQFQRAIRKLSP